MTTERRVLEWKVQGGVFVPKKTPSALPAGAATRRLLVLTGGTAEAPEVEWVPFEELLRRSRRRSRGHHQHPFAVSRAALLKFGREPHLQQRCWLSGVQLYFVPVKKLVANVLMPWSISREHLVNARDGGMGNGASNIVFVGAVINKQLGHVPLPFKLHLRSELARCEYPRDVPTLATYYRVRQAIIEVQQRHLVGKHYPWQVGCFDFGTKAHRTAIALCSEFQTAEAEFLALDDTGRQQWINEFRWRW